MMQRFEIDGGAVYLADTARVLGEVTLGPGTSVWPGAAIRGDVAAVTLGVNCNVQDNATIHCDSGVANVIGDAVSIGHNAVVHGRSVGDGTLIGMHATVLGRTVIGQRCLIAAGAVVPPGLEVPDGHVVLGVPGRIVRETTDEEQRYLAWLGEHYARLAAEYHRQPSDRRFRPFGS